jgi:hypothetical protein
LPGPWRLVRALAIWFCCITSASLAVAESLWPPFETQHPQHDTPRAVSDANAEATFLAPMDGVFTHPRDASEPGEAHQGRLPTNNRTPLPVERHRSVERAELAPVSSHDGSTLPSDFWRGLDAASLEALMAPLSLPPRSVALNGLWHRALLTPSPTVAAQDATAMLALRLEGLYRSGWLPEPTTPIENNANDPVTAALALRNAIALGNRDQECAAANGLSAPGVQLPKPLRSELLIIVGYCAASQGDRGGAGLSAELAREQGVEAPLALQVLESFAAAAKPNLQIPKRVSALDYRLLELFGPPDPALIVDKAEPALLATLARDGAIDAGTKIAVAEACVKLAILAPAALGETYRAVQLSASDVGDPAAIADVSRRRAVLFKTFEAERNPVARARIALALYDDARRSGLAMPIASLMAATIVNLALPELAWFAETGAEITLAAGRYDSARLFAKVSGAARHWLALVDIADPPPAGSHDQSLLHVEELVRANRLGADGLHQLASVLAALEVNIPLPLWEAASRIPQPPGGYLPETGVLTALQEAAKHEEKARVLLLTLGALGGRGAEGVHVIVLGDTIRALKRVGFEGEARRLALEALLASWPRHAVN